MLDAGHAVRDLREVADAALLLLLEAEGAVVGRHDREVVLTKAAPQLGLMLLVPQRRGADEVGTLEAAQPGAGEVVDGAVEVLRARLGEHVLTAVASDHHLLERLLGREVHDVQRRACHLRDLDASERRLGLHGLGPRDRVVIGRRLAPAQVVLDDLVDHDAVLAVHHDHRTEAAALLHGPEDLGIGRVEDAGVGGEQLEAGDPLPVHDVHLLQRRVVHVGDDHVEPVIDGAVAACLLVPRLEAGGQGGTLLLDGEVEDRGGATPGRCGGAGLERVRRERAAERHLHVRVHVDATGDHVLPRCVDDAGATRNGRRRVVGIGRQQGDDALALDHDGGRQRACRGDDGAVHDDDALCHLMLLGRYAD